METNDHDHPRCPIDGAALICPSCRAREIGRKGGAARTKAKSDAARKAARRPETQRRRTEAQLAAWERRRAATGAPPPERRRRKRRTRQAGSGQTQEAALAEQEEWLRERKAQAGSGQPEPAEVQPAIPPEVPDAARPEPTEAHSGSGQPDALIGAGLALARALAKRRG